MNITEIQDLIKFVSKSGVNEVEIEQKDFKLVIRANPDSKKKRGAAAQAEAAMIGQNPMMGMPAMPMQMQMAAPVAPATPAAPAQEATTPTDENSKYIEVKSPMIGTFYRSSSPDKPPFISVGDSIKPGDVVCVVEAMKLFNEIESEISGKIVKVLVDDSSPIQYDQPLFLVDPS